MGYEVAEQLNWELPEAIFYPDRRRRWTHRHVEGLDEMEHLGWLKKTAGYKRPKMIAVQASGCCSGGESLERP